jgi:F0F1-type ATP synthase membrane subunit c/vacuolar-type H+-ATPase subunit K
LSFISVFLNLGIAQALLLSGFFVAFIFRSRSSSVARQPILQRLNFQFLLFLVLENIRLATTGI